MSRINRVGMGAAISLAVLAPCAWQSRIQAGDLSSHVYNAWLVQLIEQGKAGGLTLVRQTHNVLFDVLLSSLMKVLAPGSAQRIAVGAAVLVFFWGAFAFVRSALRQRLRTGLWYWIPCLMMLTYGWVYHMGLFNFYLSLGLSFGALATIQHKNRYTKLAAGPLLALAYVAHPLPFVWAIGVMAYTWVARAIRPRHRLWLGTSSLVGLALSVLLMRALYTCRWAPDQLIAFSGADQIWVFGHRYVLLAGAVLALWGLAFQKMLAARGLRRTVLDIRFQLCALNAAGVLLIPGIVVLPASGQPESLLLGRMSLAGAVLCCALVAAAPPGKALTAGMMATAGIFFYFLYTDESALNRVEDKMERVVAQLPPGQRVVSAVVDPEPRVFSLLHVIDRVCLGRCFSYGNYEPSVGQFRVRALRDNGIAVADFRESWGIQAGGYVVQRRDLPLYRIDLCDAGGQELCAAPVEAGETLRHTWLHVTPDLWKNKGG